MLYMLYPCFHLRTYKFLSRSASGLRSPSFNNSNFLAVPTFMPDLNHLSSLSVCLFDTWSISVWIEDEYSVYLIRKLRIALAVMNS